MQPAALVGHGNPQFGYARFKCFFQPARGPERSAPDADPLPRLLIYRISSRPAPPLIEPDMIPGAPRGEPPVSGCMQGQRPADRCADSLRAAGQTQWFACIFMCLFI